MGIDLNKCSADWCPNKDVSSILIAINEIQMEALPLKSK